MELQKITELALMTRPTNDETFTFDEVVIAWREKVDSMCKVKFWETFPKVDFKNTWRLARRSLIHMNSFSLDSWLGVYSRKWREKPKVKTPVMKRRFEWSQSGCQLYGKGSIYGGLTSFARAREFLSKYLATAKMLSKHIYEFLRFGHAGKGFTNKSVKKEDIHFLFVRYYDEAFKGEKISKWKRHCAVTSHSQ